MSAKRTRKTRQMLQPSACGHLCHSLLIINVTRNICQSEKHANEEGKLKEYHHSVGLIRSKTNKHIIKKLHFG